MQKLTFEKDWCVTENIEEDEFLKETRRCGTYIVPPLSEEILEEIRIKREVEKIKKESVQSI